MNALQEKNLRALRLWHWRQALRMRELERQADSLDDILTAVVMCSASTYRELASQHIKFVQALNDFFPDPQDTAERDRQEAVEKAKEKQP